MNAPRDLGQSVLQVIFSFFVGLLVAAFVGIGVATFYPEPSFDYDDRTVFDGHRLTTSMILVVLATVIMLVSLTLAKAGPVLANGALLGGLFTMMYAVGWSLSAQNQWPRFAVLSVALAVTVAVGWWKFTRGHAPAALAPPAPDSAPSGGPADARLTAVEAKLDALARALRD